MLKLDNHLVLQMLIGGAFSHSGMSNEPLCTCLIGIQGSLRELSWKPFGCLTSYKASSSSQLQSRDCRVCIMDPECWGLKLKTPIEFWKPFRPCCQTLPQAPGNPSRMVVHVCCQKIRHGWILIWKQTSFGLTVFLEHCLVEEGLKSKCCRFCNLHWACSDQRLYFDPTVDFMFVCVPHTKASVWCDTDMTLINQSGSKVYNGICRKMLTGSGNKVPVRQKGLQS